MNCNVSKKLKVRYLNDNIKYIFKTHNLRRTKQILIKYIFCTNDARSRI